MKPNLLLVLIFFLSLIGPVQAQDVGHVTYLGNAGLLVDYQEVEILFDPFFHNHYNNYQLVPEAIRQSIFNNQTPFESVEMILISHAHGDHFDAKDVADYLTDRPQTKLVAPAQAVDLLRSDERFGQFSQQIQPISLVYGDKSVEFNFTGIKVEVLRIPHAGWPGRADVANLVYRVTLKNKLTVMHMGDADADDVHYLPWKSYWDQQVTDTAFPPYWFMLGPRGQKILAERINATHAIGVHVPVKVPEQLTQSGAEFFSETGKITTIVITNKQDGH